MREFLKGLELEKETINAIMVEYGKELNGLKEQAEDYKAEIEDYKAKLSKAKSETKEYKNQIEELNGTIENNSKDLETLQTLTNENKDLKAQIQMTGSNVKKEFMKFVTSEVSSQVNDETDFATALENYKKENPQYFGETIVKKVQTSPSLNGGDATPQNTNSIMNDIIRGAKD